MEAYERQKIVNRSMDEFIKSGLLITFEKVFKKDPLAKEVLNKMYKEDRESRDKVNNIIFTGLKDLKIRTSEEFITDFYETYKELKEENSLPESFWGAEDQEIKKEYEEWAMFYENTEDENAEDVTDIMRAAFVKVEGRENDYFVSFTNDTNLEDIEELEELLREELKIETK